MANTLPVFSKKDVHHKTVLLRVDLNVPLNQGKILNTNRLEAILDTVKDLIFHEAKVVLLSHLGRPNGTPDPALSLKSIAPSLSQLLGHPVAFCAKTIGDTAQQAVHNLNPGDVLLLENLRFQEGEEKNTPSFAQELATLGDVYINDAFAVSHRAHASTVGITKHLPSFAGPLLQTEIEQLSGLFSSDTAPIMAIVGGSKISTKIDLLEGLIKKVSHVAVGGGIANTFLLAKGYEIGTSLCEPNQTDNALRLIQQAQQKNCCLILPTDVQTAQDLNKTSHVTTQPIAHIPKNESIFDVGIATTAHIEKALNLCQTVLWNGPLGLFEHPPFDQSSSHLAHYIAKRTRQGQLKSIAGGGETLAVIQNAGARQDFTYLSTGGGAFLEYIEGRPLPGISALCHESFGG